MLRGFRTGVAVALAVLPAASAHASERVELVVELQAPSLAQSAPRSTLVDRDGRVDAQAFGSRLALEPLRSAQARVERRLRQAVPGLRVTGRMRFTLAALVVVAPAGSERRIARVRGVREVWPSTRYRAQTDRSPIAVDAVPLWTAPFGSFGDGARIAILDDGIDIRQPSFAGAGYSYPPGFPKGIASATNGKVIVARVFPPPGAPASARTAFDRDGSSHGTHVAAIAAGNSGVLGRAEGGVAVPGLSGVAPRAYLGSYRVLTTDTPSFGLDGQAAAVAQAIDQAVADGMDVINLSIGEPPVGGRDVVERAIAGAARLGVVTVAAAGNDGEVGEGTISSPGSAEDAITVGAITSDRFFGLHASVVAPEPVSPGLASFAAASDAAAHLPASWQTGIDLVAGGRCAGGARAGALVLVRHRTGCESDVAARGAKRAGAVGVVIVAEEPGHPDPAPSGPVPVLSVSDTVGASLLQAVTSAGSLRLAIEPDVRPVVDADGWLPADFSSRGPTWLGGLKPDVVAPGVGILSATPDGFGVWSGTSMAAPAVAGAAALLRLRHPDWSTADIRAAIALTARSVYVDGAHRRLSLPLTAGSGLVDTAAADSTPLLADSAAVTFGLVRAGKAKGRSITLRDAGTGAGEWQISAPGLNAPASITVPAGGSARLALSLAIPARAAPGHRQGYVTLTGANRWLRVRWWGMVERRAILADPVRPVRAGLVKGDLRLGRSRVATYRFPSAPVGLGLSAAYLGREQVLSFTVPRGARNAGVRVESGAAIPQILVRRSEDALAGVTALPVALNPYADSYGEPQPVSAVLLPDQSRYWVAVETAPGRHPGPYRLRLWVNDARPPIIDRVARQIPRSDRKLRFRVRDAGAGVDPVSLVVSARGLELDARFDRRTGLVTARLPAAMRGRVPIVIRVSDYQESKNSENAASIGLSNTRVQRTTVVVG